MQGKTVFLAVLLLPALLYGGNSPNRARPQLAQLAIPARLSLDRGWLPARDHSLGRSRMGAVSTASANTPPVIKQFEETSYYLKALAFVDANTGWAAGETHWDQTEKRYKGTILKTADGGGSWAAQETGVAEFFNAIAFFDANRGWAVGSNGTILHTGDGGAHWLRQTVDTADEFRGVVFVDSQNGWATSTRPVHRNVQGNDDDWQTTIWHTSNGGGTWSPQALPASASLVRGIYFVDTKNGWAAGDRLTGYDVAGRATTVSAIYHTSDGGITWTEQLNQSLFVCFTAIDFVDTNEGWVGGFLTSSGEKSSPLFHTTDGGTTWVAVQLPSQDWTNQLWAVKFADRNHGYVVGADYSAAWGPLLWRTVDGGATWTKVHMAKHEIEGVFAIALNGNQAVAVGDHDFLAKSTTAWAPPPNSSCAYVLDCIFQQSYINTHYTFSGVFFASDSLGWVTGSKSYSPEMWGQVILHTTDGGASWQTQFENPPEQGGGWLRGVTFTDPAHGWVVGESDTDHGAIRHTSDGGLTWTEQGAGLPLNSGDEFASVQFLDGQNGWALAADCRICYTSPHLVKTTDGGNHWTWVDSGISGTTIFPGMGALLFTDAQHGWFSGFSVIGATADGGAHWTQQPLSCGGYTCYPESMQLAFASNQNGWLAGEGLFHTTDGASWTLVILRYNSLYTGVQFPDPLHGWLIGDSGDLHSSADGGATWQSIDSGTSASLNAESFTGTQKGWIVGDFGTILSYDGNRTPAGKPAVFGVVNAASFAPGIAPNAFIAIFGQNLAASTRAWTVSDFNGPLLPTLLDGVSVKVNGKAAYPAFISPGQINVLVPADSTQGPVPVEVSTSQGTSDPFLAQMAGVSPDVFRFWTAKAGGSYVIAQAIQGSGFTWIGSGELPYDLGLSGQMRWAHPGEIITVYAVGLGPTNPPLSPDRLPAQAQPLASPVRVLVGRKTVTPEWAGQIGAGFYQINFRVPTDTPRGDIAVFIEAGGYRGAEAVISVGP